jgi:diguanylate cyclase (GGDEF)-like protein
VTSAPPLRAFSEPVPRSVSAKALTLHDVQAAPVAMEGEAFDLVGILSGVDETAYLWDIHTDHISWESNAVKVLAVRNAHAIETGAEFRFNVAAEHSRRRDDAILGASGRAGEKSPTTGLPYRVQYRFTPGGRRSETSLWIEDRGRMWTDATGKPLRARGIIRLIDEEHEGHSELLQRTDQDELTGQLNRVRLTEAVAAITARSQETQQPAAFLMVAINNLATINQTFGFDIGDEVIASAARTLRRRLRGGDTIGRYSSNKFGIVLSDCGPGAMRIAADRFLKAVRNSIIETSACQLSATVSIGGVLMPDQAAAVQDVISHALQALDDAKTRRFDCFAAYEPRPGQATQRQRNIQIADEVSKALDKHRMRLLLQPIVDTQTLVPRHYECLLRMERDDGTLISAGEFIAVAEQLGMSHLIDQRTLELAVDILKRYPDIHLALNVSGLTPANQEWLTALQHLTAGRRSLTERLLIEITETAVISDTDQTVLFVDTVKELGCKVAIDDFGAGYTSFKSLKLLNVDMVKIDGSFIRNLAQDPQDLVFIKALRELARSLGMETVAEWVQDQTTVDILRTAGIDMLQGYFCGEPMAPDAVAAHALAQATALPRHS